MKKILFLIPLILFSCKKEASISETVSNEDSVQTMDEISQNKIDSLAIKDSIINNSPAVKKVLKEGIMRKDGEKQIVREADASQLPFNIGDEFTSENQELILKIKNFENDEISVNLVPKDKSMNIRINQITLPNGNSDGPFGKNLLNYKIKNKGEIILKIGKSNMASGETKGNFTVSLE